MASDLTDNVLLGGGLVLGIAAMGYFGYKSVSDKDDGLKKLAEAAGPVSKEFGIPLSFIVTQAAHESNFGRSGLALRSNNLFGVKVGAAWHGLFDVWPTYEVIGGKEVKLDAKFRHYANWGESIRDWANLIKTRYPKAFMAALDHNASRFFQELQNGGYATDPSYAIKLAGVFQQIEAFV